MPEATINDGVIECGKYRIMDDAIFQNEYYCWRAIIWEKDFEDLYQVLHAWHMAKAVDKTYLGRLAEAMKNDQL
jgi:hypothetical protein